MKKLYVIGIGPGRAEDMTCACRNAIEKSDIIAGYSTYIDLVSPLFPEKPVYQTGMTREVERCVEALQLAEDGKIVAMVCSGDAGVFGMSGLVYELSRDYPEVEIEVIPGVTAALSGSAVLGAPLTHDFAVISLSDLLTPWELIEKRLGLAAQGDFCIAIYNPSSKKRSDYLAKACRILMEYKSHETVCGYVKNIARSGESYRVCTLRELESAQVDMFTTVFIGNSQTRRIGEKMVTPRGYRLG